MDVMDTAAQPSEERCAFLGVKGRAAPCGVEGAEPLDEWIQGSMVL